MLAVDPSSPFTGGAILGDRVRMQDHATDPGVFIRSMATRGHLGGLALATPEAIRLLDALGHRWIIVETVGRRPGRGRGRRQGRHDGRRRQPGVGRQRAGGQGRPDGGRRRLRHQQGRPGRRRRDPPRPAADARPAGRHRGADDRRVAGADRRRRWRRRARASPRCGTRSLAHRAHIDRLRRARAAGAASASARSCARSSPAASSSGLASCAPATGGTS